MTNVLIGQVRDAMPLDLMRANTQESMLDGMLADLFSPEQIEGIKGKPSGLDQFIYGLSRTAQGREFFEWILDFTLRAPLRFKAPTLEETALNAARREGMNFPAEMILAAISRGEQSIAARSPGAK